MPGLFDFLESDQAMGVLPYARNWLGNNSNALIGLGAGIASGNGWGEGVAKGLQGVLAGRQTDISQAKERQKQLAQIAFLGGMQGGASGAGAGISPAAMQLLISDPKAFETYFGQLIKPQLHQAGNTTLQSTPFGGVEPVYRDPGKPELVESYDPTTGRMVKSWQQPPDPTGAQGVLSGPNKGALSGATPPAPQATRTAGGGSPAGGGVFSAPSPAEKEEQTQVGRGLGEDYTKIQNTASSATKVRTVLQRMRQLNPNVYEGAAAPLKQYFSSLATSFGIAPDSISKSASAGDLFTALSNRMVIDAQNGSLGTGVSNNDVRVIAQTFPELSQTRDGRTMIIDSLDRLKGREQEIANLAKDYRRRTGSMDGFQSYLATWAENNPLFKDLEANAPRNFNNRFNAATSIGSEWTNVNGIQVRRVK